MRKLPFIIICLFYADLSPLWAGSGRDEFQKAYATYLEDSPNVFNSAPVYHIVPTENTITFAGAYQYADVLVAAPGANAHENSDALDARLDMTGWSATPYVAFLSKRFGFGFAGEVGDRQIHFLRKPGTETYEEHLGKLAFSGVGFNAFWKPEWRLLPRFAVPTFIAGLKTLNVIHKSSGDLAEPFSEIEMTKYQYTVQNYEAGCNLRLNFVKRFTIVPWIDYSTYVFGQPKRSESNGSSQTEDESLNDDRELVWSSAPALTYGIDFGVEIFGVSIRLGGLIGMLGNLHKGNDRVNDSSHNLSLSFDIKAN